MDFRNSESEERSGARPLQIQMSIGSVDAIHFVNYEHVFPRHAHDYFTIGVFGPDNGHVWYRRSTWRAWSGAILAVGPDEAHAAEPLRHRGWTYRAFYPPARLVAMALGVETPSLAVAFDQPIVDNVDLARLIGVLQRSDVTRGQSLYAEELFLAVLRRLITRYASPRASPRNASSPGAVGVARDYLEAHFGESIKLSALAAICGTSPYHLIRTFRDKVGMPPHAYLTQIRIHRARDMILRGESLSAAAYLCGFGDQSHLTRVFKRTIGITPGAYVAACGTARSTRDSHTMRARRN